MDTEATQPTLEAGYEALRAGLLEAHQPRNAHERVLVEEFIDACWDLKAAHRVAREFWSCAGSHYSGGEAGIAEAQLQEKESRFRTHLRYHAGCERSYYRALAALKALSLDTGRPAAAAPATLEPGEPVREVPERVDRVDRSISRLRARLRSEPPPQGSRRVAPASTHFLGHYRGVAAFSNST